ncbi:hypothetical protein MFKK_27300 [Halopseudomonas aestusnigri]|nr:hypothetical protein MFKK_27300 [Halopseudomonas aestusnigri]
MLDQLAGSFKATDTRHAHVHQDDVRLKLAGANNGSLSAIGLAYDRQARDIAQHATDACAHQVVVIDYQYLDQVLPLEQTEPSYPTGSGGSIPTRSLTIMGERTILPDKEMLCQTMIDVF